MIFFAILLLFLAITRPYNDSIENFLSLFNSLGYFIVLSVFTLLEILKNQVSEEFKYNVIGHLIIALLGLIVGLNLIVGFVASIMGFKEIGDKYIWGKKKPEKKLGKNENLDESAIMNIN